MNGDLLNGIFSTNLIRYHGDFRYYLHFIVTQLQIWKIGKKHVSSETQRATRTTVMFIETRRDTLGHTCVKGLGKIRQPPSRQYIYTWKTKCLFPTIKPRHGSSTFATVRVTNCAPRRRPVFALVVCRQMRANTNMVNGLVLLAAGVINARVPFHIFSWPFSWQLYYFLSWTKFIGNQFGDQYEFLIADVPYKYNLASQQYRCSRNGSISSNKCTCVLVQNISLLYPE